jgi:RNA polymerase sigma-70 factor (ECF subfamily)
LEELEILITDCKAGKREAQSRLYQLYAPMLFGVCLRYSRDRTEAEDSLHEGFVLIFNKIDQFAFKGSFEGWMKKIMVNLSLEKCRTRFKMQTVEDISIYDSKSADADVYADMNAAKLLELIQNLPPQYRLVFNMYAIDGYSHKEISQELGIAEGTSKSNLARARKILQDKVVEMGYIGRVYAE